MQHVNPQTDGWVSGDSVNPNTVCWILMSLSCYGTLNQQFTSNSDKLSLPLAFWLSTYNLLHSYSTSLLINYDMYYLKPYKKLKVH